MGNKVPLIILLVIAMIAALFLGSTIGQARYVDLSKYGVVIFVLLYLTYLYRFTWQIVLFIYTAGLRFNFGFDISSTHISVLLLFLYALLIWGLRRNPLPRPEIFDTVKVNRLIFVIAALLLYGVFSFTFNKISPFGGGDYATRNMLKGYFDGFGPSLFLLTALVLPYSFRIKESILPTILITIFFGSLLNLAHLVYLFGSGYGGALDASEGDQVSAFFIPVINATLGAMTLRGIGPLAVMFSFAAMCYPGWFRAQSPFIKAIAVGVFMIGMAGAVMSGGRAAVIMALFFIFFISLVYRKMILIFSSICMGLLVIVIANLFSSYINNRLPTFVARPLQYIMIQKGDAMESIEFSSKHRSALYWAAIDEWKSDPRILLFGRSVYVPADKNEEIERLGNLGGFVSTNLQSGTAHALLPSSLIQYGIIGTSLYYLVYIMLIRYFWKIYQRTKRGGYSQELKILSLLFTVSFTLSLVIATIGGAWFGAYQILMVVLVKCMAARDEKAWVQETETTSDGRLKVGQRTYGQRALRPNPMP